ncbi:MAG: SCO family protein, partial [Candidatus Kapaibacterium sp.]
MKKLSRILITISLILLAASCSKNDQSQQNSGLDTTSTSEINRGSIYDVNPTLDNQNGERIAWQSLKGKIHVMAMIFTHCPAACPIITQQIKRAEARIPASAQGKVVYTLISFDATRDTASRLREFYAEQGLDSNWQLLHGSAEDVR